MKKRIPFWDNLKGILIVLVVFGHFISAWANDMPGGDVDLIYKFIYLFHMPAFVFCAGFWSNTKSAEGKSGIVKLLLCYLLFNTLMMVYYWGVEGVAPKLLTPYNSYWFLLSLVTWRLTAKHISHIKGILIYAVALALLAGFWKEADNTLSIMRTMGFFPFFLLGYKLNTEKNTELLHRRPKWLMLVGWGIGLVGAAAAVLVLRCFNLTEEVLTMQPYYSSRDVVLRAGVMAVAFCVIVVLCLVVPNMKLPLLTNIGKNSLIIYLFHRFVTLIFSKLLPASGYSRKYLIYAAVATALTVLLFGAEWLSRWFNKVLSWMTDELTVGKGRTTKMLTAGVLVLVLLITSLPLQQILLNKQQEEPEVTAVDVEARTTDKVVVAFVGDLVLLKEQVEAAYDKESGNYDFSNMFVYVAPYLQQADYAIGVLEGPLAGKDAGYTTSDFDDGYPLYMNFPDQFAADIKESGIDMVTTANNHLLDHGPEGAMRTLDVLDQTGLDHVGSYRNEKEKQLKLVEVQGVKIAILAYTQLVNYYDPSKLPGQLPYITSVLPEESNPYYQQLLAEMKEDFTAAQAAADVVMVLPHMGTQFSHETDAFQDQWNKLFAQMGADVILGNHAHAVQPLDQIGDTLVVNCPGNVADGYVGNDSDAKALIEIYIDPQTKTVSASAIVPMYTQEAEKGSYRALPIYDALTDRTLRDTLPSVDLVRMEQVHRLVTRVMLGTEVQQEDMQPRYYYIDGAYRVYNFFAAEVAESYTRTKLYSYINDAKTIAFVGDSITSGKYNGGIPWYQPLLAGFHEKDIINIASDCTLADFLDKKGDVIKASAAELYIVALGMNDIRSYAVNPENYKENLTELLKALRNVAPNARCVVIAPWYTPEQDRDAMIAYTDRLVTSRTCSELAEDLAAEQDFLFIDPNSYIEEYFQKHPAQLYLVGGMYPNKNKGVILYANAVLASEK